MNEPMMCGLTAGGVPSFREGGLANSGEGAVVTTVRLSTSKKAHRARNESA